MSRNGRPWWIPLVSFAALAAVPTSMAQEAAKPTPGAPEAGKPSPNAIDIGSLIGGSRGGGGGAGGANSKFRDFNEVTKDAEKIASRWADHRGVSQVAFKPDWARRGKAAPFKRNDQMLDVLPIGVVVFPGTGIQDNLADKAKKQGIPVFDFRTGGA